MSELLSSIDGRTKLAGTNKLELLLFSLGTDSRTGREEVFGINVFKVREVMRTPPITAAPEMPDTVKGMVSLRGGLIPVVDLAHYAHVPPEQKRDIMIITEYNSHTQGFLVHSVDTILRLDWTQMKAPPEMLMARMGGLITAVTELADGRLVMLLDVERILSETTNYDSEAIYKDIMPIDRTDAMVIFADDSYVARRQLQKTLDLMQVNSIATINGKQAGVELLNLATAAEAEGHHASDVVHLVIADIEMPELDGYMLTKMIKSNPRFSGIPVIMHSSLSGNSNLKLGQSVGVDEYISKFEPKRLAEVITRLLGKQDALTGKKRHSHELATAKN